MLSRTSAYVKDYDGKTKWIYYLIKDDGLLNKCDNIWNQIRVDIKIELNSKLLYTKTIFHTKAKSYGEVTDFHDKEVPKEDSSYTCSVMISIDSIFKMDETITDKCF